MAEEKEQRRFYALIAGAVVSAFLASTCCLAPLLFLLFGVSVSSLSFLQVFAPYHGYFSAAALLLSLYLWIDYLRKKRTQTACCSRLCRYHLHYLVAGTLFVVLFVSYPYWIDRFI
jgi:hypothetical protein